MRAACANMIFEHWIAQVNSNIEEVHETAIHHQDFWSLISFIFGGGVVFGVLGYRVGC